MRWLSRAVTGAFVAGLLGFVVAGADTPADPSLGQPEPSTTSTAPTTVPTVPPPTSTPG